MDEPEAVATHRTKLRELFAFWGWEIRDRDCCLAWHVDADLSLAVWAVWRQTPEGLQRHWVVSEPTGVLPIDQLDGGGIPNAAAALRAFAARWRLEAASSLEERIGPERTAFLRRERPGTLEQAAQLRSLLTLASDLLEQCADDPGQD